MSVPNWLVKNLNLNSIFDISTVDNKPKFFIRKVQVFPSPSFSSDSTMCYEESTSIDSYSPNNPNQISPLLSPKNDYNSVEDEFSIDITAATRFGKKLSDNRRKLLLAQRVFDERIKESHLPSNYGSTSAAPIIWEEASSNRIGTRKVSNEEREVLLSRR